MSRQNAERSEDFVSVDARLDSILDQLNALATPGSRTPAAKPSTPRPPMPVSKPPERMLKSVPDLELEGVTQTFDQAPEVTNAPPLPDVDTPPPLFGLVASPADAIELAPPPIPPDLIDQSTTPIAPVFTEPAPVSSEPVPFAPAPELEFVVEPAPFSAEPAPVVVEHDEIRIEPAPPEVSAESSPVEVPVAEEGPQVFPLDGPLATDADAEMVPLPQTVEQHLDSNFTADPGWVSHHTDELTEAPLSHETPSAEFATFDTFVPVAEGTVNFDQVDVVSEVPQWGDFSEQIVETEFEPVVLDTAEESCASTELHFHTDEDLPLPDFTGVWADSQELEVCQDDAALAGVLPGPLEGHSKSGISVGRNELDSLRPVDDVVVAKTSQPLGRKLQLVGVVLFGLIALAVMFLDDPAVIDELREIYDGFFG